MPRIRKKTSKRGTTANRAKVKRKVSESRRKSKKAAKKDPTWKSKKPNDPGIPNNFPYKDQVLAEIAAERRQAAEAKARRKEEKKSLRAQQKSTMEAKGRGDGDDGGSADEDNDDVEDGHFDGIATLGGPTGTRKAPSKSTEGISQATSGGSSVAASASTAGAAAKDVAPPPLLNPDLPHLAVVLEKADVVIEVLDTRDPLAHRSSALEAHVASKEGQKLLLVLNKIDTCPREPTAAWAAHLRSEHPTLLFRAASAFLSPVVSHEPTKGKRKSKEPLDDAWGFDAVSQLLGSWAQEKTSDESLHVAVVGLANSGKSSFINSLARNTTLDIYTPTSSTNYPTTTPHALEVTLELNGKPVVLIDTPGLAWQPSAEEDRERRRAQDVLLRNKGRIDRLKDSTPAVSYIVSRAEAEDLMVLYGLPAFAKGDVDAFLVGIARAHGLIKKGGNPDLAAAARIVLRDWSIGKISRYAVPPASLNPGTAAAVSPTLATLYAGDATLLERLTPRKELRRTGNLVRLSSERIDDRALVLETPWIGADTVEEGESDEDGEDEDEGEVAMEIMGSGTGEEDEEGTDEAGLIESDEDGEKSVSDEDDSNDGDGDSENADEEDEDKVSPSTHSSPRKRKRLPPSTILKQQSDPARPSKRVTFAAEVVSSNKRTPKPHLVLARRPVVATHSKKQKIDLSRPSATTPSSKKAISGVGCTQRAPVGGAPMRARKPAANAPTPVAAQKRKEAASAGGVDGAYDFSKFF